MTGEATGDEGPGEAVVVDGDSDSGGPAGRDGRDGRGSGRGRDPGTTELLSAEEREFLLEAVRRAPVLEYLGRAPASAAEVIEEVELSRSTVHRALDSLLDHDIVRKRETAYELTNLGQLLLAELERFGRRAGTARSLGPFLNAIDLPGTEIPLEDLRDATVIRREPRRPHATIHRIMELFDAAEDVRMFSTVISPVYVDMAYPKMVNGMEIQAVFEREVVDLMVAEYPEKARETMMTGNFDVHAHEDLPFELFVFDDRVGFAAHNQQGNAEVLIESEDPAVVDWAEDLYERYLSEATSVPVSDV